MRSGKACGMRITVVTTALWASLIHLASPGLDSPYREAVDNVGASSGRGGVGGFSSRYVGSTMKLRGGASDDVTFLEVSHPGTSAIARL